MEETVESHARRCLQLFSKAVDASKASTDDPPAYFNRGVRDEQTRFKVWSGNIAAHRTGTGSLDHRLRDSSNIRNQVVNLLRDLSGLLEDAIAIVTGEETSWDQLSGDEDAVLGEDAEDSDSPDTELEQISIDVTDAVNCLLRLSVAIRDPAPHDRFVISDSADTSHYEQFDIQHVCSKFGSIDSGLAERLGKAITRRRQFFKYREDNRIGDGETAVSSLLEGKLGASRISGLPVPEDNCSDSEISQTSYASSAGDVEQRCVPPLPTEASEGPFECPFCYMMIAVADESSWNVNLNSAQQYQSHVGRHQEQLALFALPDLESDDEFDLYDDDLSDFESIEAGSDNDLLSPYPNANTVRSDSFEADQNQHAPIEEPPSTSSALEIPDHPEVPNYGRRNEYFVPRDDIDQEVIATDICHHLGKDAIVRPGQYMSNTAILRRISRVTHTARPKLLGVPTVFLSTLVLPLVPLPALRVRDTQIRINLANTLGTSGSRSRLIQATFITKRTAHSPATEDNKMILFHGRMSLSPITPNDGASNSQKALLT
ncbi:hypothetical protein CDV31_015232 [Fusarium ambrosium]|uniref:Oxidoreductase acuF-like C2H2 type zinc-finger domain-containing protein n=1 Tax=Fusarium ambrosium TaxID=131363 RepID=A0A428SR73_9HYPO|nr:hypothetical protein CDV31_015232 [Fusarium ambrosium]